MKKYIEDVKKFLDDKHGEMIACRGEIVRNRYYGNMRR